MLYNFTLLLILKPAELPSVLKSSFRFIGVLQDLPSLLKSADKVYEKYTYTFSLTLVWSTLQPE